MKSGGKRRFAVASVVGTLVLFVALVAYTQEDPYALLKKPKELHSFFPDTAVGRSDFIPASAGSGHEPYEDQGTSSNAYGFYNVYANGSAFRDIVEDQIKTLEATGALARLRKVFIIAIGPDNADVRIDNPKFELLKTAASADESFTLHSVWSFCREPAHHDDIVLCEDCRRHRERPLFIDSAPLWRR